MVIDVKTLFKIVGEEGPALRRVEEAIEWLLSPKAEGLGQKLLHDAHALHGKPLTIAVSEASSGYIPGEHIVHLNPHQVENVSFLTAEGVPHKRALEGCIGHELKHAGQARLQEGAAEKAMLEGKIGDAYRGRLTAEQSYTLHEQRRNIFEAPNYHTARQHLEKYVDETLLPMMEATDRELFAHPDYIKHVQEFEMPAIEIENRIATLRGEPIRADYASTHIIPPEQKREMIIEELSTAMQLGKKPRLAPEVTQRLDGQSWAKSLGNRSGRKLG
jgi:hypothetical protein